MNQRIFSSLTATFLITTLSVATSSQAQQVTAIGSSTEANLPADSTGQVPKTATPTSTQLSLQPTDVVKVGELQSQTSTTADEQVVAKIHAYELEGRQAAILYVRSIPVLTFFGSHQIAANDTKMGEATARQKTVSDVPVSENTASRMHSNRGSDVNQSENDPVWRATAVAARLNQLSRDNSDADAITVRWKADCNCYSINVNNEELVEINQQTVLPDTTRNLAEDALQATNRLRRLMGNAPPLQEIAGKPAERAVAQVSLGAIRFQVTGIASWYGPGFHGRPSASGERYNQNAMTAAHRSLPFGTNVQVTNLNNGRSVVVRINDRGPYARGRIIDLSAAAARVLGVMQTGIAPVKIEVLDPQQTIIG
ncbi:MAG TPA: septal ring lytic transglycosylase RlpA family protein, partial [Cyanophyceae cyanobacterium]